MRTRTLAWMAALLSAGGLGCGSGEDDRVVVRPGDSLFDLLPAVRVERFPETNLPEAIRAPVTAFLRDPSCSIAPEAWEQVKQKEGLGEDVWLWRVAAPLRGDLELGRVWFEHEGRTLWRGVETSTWQGASLERTWRDGDLAIFWIQEETGELKAACPRRPGPVSYGYRFDERRIGAWIGRIDAREALPSDVEELVGRTMVRDSERFTIERPALVAPAPSALVVDIDELHADELRIACLVPDVAFVADKGRVRTRRSPSDGVTFTIEAVAEDGTSEVLWSRHVDELNRFLEAAVSVGRFRGRALTLRLRTDPGPAANAGFDYAVWSGLRFHGAPERAPARPHVVLIDVDTLRADRLGCYGYERPTSPRIDAWVAENATLYTDCTSAGDWTLPSTVSMLTGLGPAQHGLLTQPMTTELEPLAVRLRAAGYETYGRADGGFLASDFGFGLGFDVYEVRKRDWEEQHAVGWEPELERIRDRKTERPLFVFLQTYMVHGPYADDRRFEDPARPYDGPYTKEPMTQEGLIALLNEGGAPPTAADWRYMNDVYDAGVRRMDDVVGNFLDGLAETFGDEPYLVIFTSDHGEELSERGLFGHGHSLHREVLHVPLMIRYPGGSRIGPDERPTSGLDLVPTILDVVGLPTPDHLPGRSLRADLPPRRLVIARHSDSADAVAYDGWKLLLGSIEGYGGPTAFPNLYRLADDLGERQDLAADEPEVVRTLTDLLERFRAEYPTLELDRRAADIDPSVAQELDALGY